MNSELNNMTSYSTEELSVINYASWAYMGRACHNFDILIESPHWSKDVKDQIKRLKYEIDRSKIAFNILKRFGEDYFTQQQINEMEDMLDNYSKRYQEYVESIKERETYELLKNKFEKK